MRSIFQNIWWGGDPDQVDSVSGLSRRDTYVIQRSWERLYVDPIDNGMWLFVQLFRDTPTTQDLFGTIKGLPEDQLRAMPQFKAHVLNFMTYLNMTVGTIQEPEIGICLMHKLGRSHRRFGVKPEHFHTTSQVLVKTLKTSLHASDDVIESWSRFIRFLFKPLFESLTSED